MVPVWVYITHTGHLASKDAYSTAINDLLICVEMFLAAVAHHYIFSFREFETEEFLSQKMTFRESISHLFTFNDVTDDVVGSLKTATASAAQGTRNVFHKEHHQDPAKTRLLSVDNTTDPGYGS